MLDLARVELVSTCKPFDKPGQQGVDLDDERDNAEHDGPAYYVPQTEAERLEQWYRETERFYGRQP